ncbi:FAD-dependent oxidoreductase [Streptomyces sp. SID8379]|uniref:FAD-dependent oxidoreductase n=1 Tax=unclassified Streptomyces TaxID=2593676 RepID=UPI0003762982|nr:MULTISPECIES: FAD-dependent oxidoreductase [unclassified Streptomyces]MYW68458.1 FAD-dependent oxidoreductase [Streptomyces sp. SID8379]
MDAITDAPVDVVVCGGGPVGLLLACELRLGGASVAVLERLTAIDHTIKAGAINSPSAEALYRRGFLPEMERVQHAAMERFRAFLRESGGASDRHGQHGRKVPPKFAGHFAGLPLDGALLDEGDPEFQGKGPAADVGFLAQAQLEELLERRAGELGVLMYRGRELTEFQETADGITVRVSDGSVLRASWLVGCDGGRSRVRKLAGFDFPGTPPEITGHQALVEMTGGEALRPGWNTTCTGVYAYGPMPGRILTVEFDGPPADRESPVTETELTASIRGVTGVDVTVTAIRSATRFTDNARQATTYRKGRVLLAGDAAHVHSPFGGQGLNLGIGDAMNLGWKLAATVRGTAPAGLLDTYTAERHPIGAWVLEWTRAQIAVMRPDRHARALRAVVGDLLGTVTGTTYFVKKISGVEQRCPLPDAVDHPLVGRSAPDLELADGTRLADHLHTGRALLLDLADSAAVRKHAADHDPGRLTVVTTTSPGHPTPAALLVRPDGCVAWAADTDTCDGLPEALARWIG